MSQLTDKLDDLVSETTRRMNEHKVMREALKDIAERYPCPFDPTNLMGCLGCVARRALRFVEGDSK